MRRTMLIGCAAVAVTAFASLALGAESDVGKSYLEQQELAPSQAFELTAGMNYTQGFGQFQKGNANNINDIANAGVGFDVGAGYRINPMVSLGVDGQYQEFSTGRTFDSQSSARGAAFDVDATVHFSPYRRLDPWLKVASGYRLLWQVPAIGVTTLYHGFDIAKVQAGLDIRSAPGVAIGPMIGADMNVFFWDRGAGGANTAIADPRLNTFVYAGIQGRFDAGGVNVQNPSTTLARAF